MIFPIRWDAPLWSRRRLVEGPRSRQRQLGAVERLSGSIVPEPILTRLEACYDKVASLAKMRCSVLVWRRIATADVAAFGATPQMEPPLASSKTLDTSRSTWNGVRVNAFRYVAHCCSASVRSSGRMPTVLCYRRLVMPSQRGPLRVQTPHRKRPGPCSRDEDEHIWTNGAAEVGVSFAAQV